MRAKRLESFLKQLLTSCGGLYGYMTRWQVEHLKRLISEARFHGADIQSEYQRTVVFGRYEILWAELCVRDLAEEAKRIAAEEGASA